MLVTSFTTHYLFIWQESATTFRIPPGAARPLPCPGTFRRSTLTGGTSPEGEGSPQLGITIGQMRFFFFRHQYPYLGCPGIRHCITGNKIERGSPSCTSDPATLLPNPRYVSIRFHTSNDVQDSANTHMLTQFGQFLDHDITLTPEVS